MNIGEPKVAALAAESEAFVVDAKLVQDGRMKVMNMDLVLDGVIAKFIGSTIGQSRFHATTSHPHRKAMRMVIAPPGTTHHLSDRSSTELATPDDKSVVEKSALLEVSD